MNTQTVTRLPAALALAAALLPTGWSGLASAQVPGTTFRDCKECPEMVVLPAGSFVMGSPASETGRDDNEGPQHRVTIGSLLAVGKYEVTFAEWDACARAGGCARYKPSDRGWGRGRRPVINVSWEDARSYVLWLFRMTGKRYRLLSEAEWEYAARAGTATPYHFGERISPDDANYGKLNGGTVPVGSYSASRFGLHDMHGNVWEWVEDCWNKYYRGAPSDGRPWQSGYCFNRILRGGSWKSAPRGVRSANRLRGQPGGREIYDGFRVARTLTP